MDQPQEVSTVHLPALTNDCSHTEQPCDKHRAAVPGRQSCPHAHPTHTRGHSCMWHRPGADQDPSFQGGFSSTHEINQLNARQQIELLQCTLMATTGCLWLVLVPHTAESSLDVHQTAYVIPTQAQGGLPTRCDTPCTVSHLSRPHHQPTVSAAQPLAFTRRGASPPLSHRPCCPS